MGLAGFLGIDSMSIFPTGRSVIFLIPVIAQVGIGKPLFSLAWLHRTGYHYGLKERRESR
jgi:hypothetical protein